MNIVRKLAGVLVCLSVGISIPAFAQQKTSPDRTVTITGTVSDAAGNAIPGAAVMIKDSESGTVTDLDGKFRIDVPGGTVLTFSALSYVTQELSVSEKKDVKIVLEDDMLKLDEVVVVGYGSQNKTKITGAVATVSTSDFKDRPLTDVSLALQGKVSGVQVTQNSGQPGADAGTVTIRGIGTFNNASPLVIVDGFESSFDKVDSKDIESITVLKDAASAAIYGNKAANGVILIKTKSAKAQQMKISYTGYGAVQTVTSYPELLNSLEYLSLYNEAGVNSGRLPAYEQSYLDSFDGRDPGFFPDHDWAEWYLKPALMHSHHVSMSGGTDDVSFTSSLGFLGQDGIIEGTDYQKINFRINTLGKYLNKKLQVGFNAYGYKGKKTDFCSGTSGVLGRIVYMQPYTIPYYEDFGYNSWFRSDALYENGGTDTTDQYNVGTQLFLDATLFPFLKFSLSANYDYTSNSEENYQPNIDVFTIFTGSDGTTTYVDKYEGEESSINESTSVANYASLYAKFDFWKRIANYHTLWVLAGWQADVYDYKWYYVTRSRLSSNIPSLNAGDPETLKSSNDASSTTSVAWFARLNYDYKEKYLFEANFRADGSSKFAEGHKWGFFPSFSTGWRVSEERFMDSVRWVDELKLRASWGKLGNQNIWSAYAGKDVMAIGTSNYFIGNQMKTGAATSYIASDDLTWETTTQTNIGLDFYFLHQFSLTVDAYNKRTDDILMRLPVSKTYGFTENPYKNAGVVRNRGIDFDLQYFNTFGKLRVKAGATLSFNRNTVLDLHGQSPIIDSEGGIVLQEGLPINSLYGFETDGIYQSEGEIKDHLKMFDEDGNVMGSYVGLKAEPGDIKFVDQDGDGVIDLDKDRVALGSPNPDFLYSFNVSLYYGKFDFTAFFQGVQGGIGWSCGYLVAPFYESANCARWLLDRWTPENPNNTVQRVFLDDQRSAIKSRYYVEDLSYLRLKNIELGYTLPHARIYVSGQNVFTLTRFKGFDPERSGVSSSNIYDYPLVKTWTVGVNINF